MDFIPLINLRIRITLKNLYYLILVLKRYAFKS